MSYPLHQNDPESYENSNKPWFRTDLPTSTPVGGFDPLPYPSDNSLLSADPALWSSSPEHMMHLAHFCPDGGGLGDISHFMPTNWPEYDLTVSQDNSPFRPADESLDQQSATAFLPAANYYSYSPLFTTGSTMSTASGSSSDISTFSITGSSAPPRATTAALPHPTPPPSGAHLLLPLTYTQPQQPFSRGYDTSNSNAVASSSTGGLTEEQLLDAAIEAERRRQSTLPASPVSPSSPANSAKSYTSIPSRPSLPTTTTSTTIKGPAPTTNKRPADDNANFETDPALIPRAYMRPNAARASQACVACRRRKVRCVPLTNSLPSSNTEWSQKDMGPLRNARDDGAGPIAGRCCRRCAKIGIECIWAKERRGKRSTPSTTASPLPAIDNGAFTSSVTDRSPIGAVLISRSPSATSVLTKATTTGSLIPNTVPHPGSASQLPHSSADPPRFPASSPLSSVIAGPRSIPLYNVFPAPSGVTSEILKSYYPSVMNVPPTDESSAASRCQQPS